MGTSFIFICIFAVLFIVSFISKRRFGVLGLALIAGETLNQLWTAKLTPIVANAGVTITNPPLAVLVAAALILLPALCLLINGPVYHQMHRRIIGATLFGALGTVLLLEPVGNMLWLADYNRVVYDWLVANKVYIVTGGVMVAILDLISAHAAKPHHGRPAKH